MEGLNRSINGILIASGFVFLILSSILVWQRYAPRPLLSESSATHAIYPTSIRIPSIGVKLPIIPSQFTNNQFQTTNDGVSYLASTPLPGTIGNSVMYGHNWPNLLGDLPKIKTGDLIVVEQGNKITRFTVAFINVVSANETHVQQNTNDIRLTIYTCTGFFDSKRFVVKAIVDPNTVSSLPKKSV